MEANRFMFLVLAMAMITTTVVHGQGTSVGFYTTTCPNAESIIQSTVQSHFSTQRAVAPWLLRMHFHDCFVQGCDGSILIDGTNSEKTAPANGGLLGFEVIDDAKTKLEAACPGIVSCADILALATRDAVVLTNGPTWAVPTGRRDGRVSTSANMNTFMPLASDSIEVQKNKFAAVGLNTQDLVTLVAGHTIGTARCSFFNFNDPTLNSSFVTQMRGLCGSPSNRVELDIGSSGTFDTSFLDNVRNGKGVLPSDRLLWTDASTKPIVQGFLGAPGVPSLNFNAEFIKSMIKMSNAQVKTGTVGEIRKKCSVIN